MVFSSAPYGLLLPLHKTSPRHGPECEQGFPFVGDKENKDV